MSTSIPVGVAMGMAAAAAAAARTPPPAPSPLSGHQPALSRLGTPDDYRGERLYRTLCRSCHGDHGRGDTALARELSPAPGDLARGNFKYRSTPSGALPTDRDLLRTLYVGIPGTAMVGLANLLPLRALYALVRQVKLRSPRFAVEGSSEPMKLAAPSAGGTPSAARGADLFRVQGCPRCHGPDGDGHGPLAAGLKDALDRPIRPRDFTRGVFRSGFTRADVVRAFSTGLNGTPMPALADDVSAAARHDLAAHLISLSAGRSPVLRYLESRPGWVEPLTAAPR